MRPCPFMLPMLPEDDYPPLPSLPPEAGALPGSDFAQAVAQTYIAASRPTRCHFTGIRLEAGRDTLTLAATDRYRLAVRELDGHRRWWVSVGPSTCRAARSPTWQSLSAPPPPCSWPGTRQAWRHALGIVGDDRRFTTRLLDPQFPKFRDLLPEQFASSVRADVARALGGHQARGPGGRAEHAGATGHPRRRDRIAGQQPDETQAQESVEAQLESSPMVIAFNPHLPARRFACV